MMTSAKERDKAEETCIVVRRERYGSVLIPKNLSHPSFVTVVIVHSYWAVELMKSKFHSYRSTNFKKQCIAELSQKLFADNALIVTA